MSSISTGESELAKGCLEFLWDVDGVRLGRELEQADYTGLCLDLTMVAARDRERVVDSSQGYDWVTARNKIR